MLMTEWNWDDALAVRFEEGREEGMEAGIERGIEQGLEQGALKIARNALAKGASIEFIHEITGLDVEAIKELAG